MCGGITGLIPVLCLPLCLPQATLDYNATVQLIEFAPEERQQTVTIAILDDDLREDVERFSVQLRVLPGGRGVVLGNLSSAEVVIDDDDSKLSVCLAILFLLLISSLKPYQLEISLVLRPSHKAERRSCMCRHCVLHPQASGD